MPQRSGSTSSLASGSTGSYCDIAKTYNHPNHHSTGRRMVFAGPDANSLFQKAHLQPEQGLYIGSTERSGEMTTDARYLFRGLDDKSPMCRMRHQRPGELGWNAPNLCKNSVLPVVIAPGRR